MTVPKNFISLEKEELNVAEIINLTVSPNCGAIATFVGITRDNFEKKKVVKLGYEAYEPMVLKAIDTICTNIRNQWNVHHIAIYHRIGDVPVSKASVAIAISAPHRQDSIKAVEYAITALKSSVPIWKAEVYDNGESQWKENKECPWSSSK